MPPSAQSDGGEADAIAAAVWAWEDLRDARTLGDQANAMAALSDAMSDLASWHPNYSMNSGEITGREDE